MLLSLLLRAADGLLHAAVRMERRNALTVLCFLRRPLLTALLGQRLRPI